MNDMHIPFDQSVAQLVRWIFFVQRPKLVNVIILTGRVRSGKHSGISGVPTMCLGKEFSHAPYAFGNVLYGDILYEGE